jgi:putative ABC transport system permease protein
MTALGLAVGLGACAALARGMKSLVYGVHPMDPLTLVSVAALRSLVAIATTFVPARRATRIDPMAALRSE